LVGPGDEREAEFVVGCPAVAAGEIPPASWQLEQTNKRAQELQGVLRQAGETHTCGERRLGVEFTAVVLMADGGGSEPVASRAAAAWLHL
jgi:hypothetical protein